MCFEICALAFLFFAIHCVSVLAARGRRRLDLPRRR